MGHVNHMINITLLIQVFHFWLAYLIMTRILLRPVSTSIFTEQEEERTLEKSVDHAAQAITLHITANKHQWSALQKQLQAQQPPHLTITRQPQGTQLSSTPTPAILSPEQYAQLRTQLTTLIVQRVAHDS